MSPLGVPPTSLTSEQASEGAWLSYAYQFPTVDDGTLVPKLTVTNCARGTTLCSAENALTWEQILSGGLGRKDESRVRLEAGMSSAFTTEYYNNRGKLVLVLEKRPRWELELSGTSGAEDAKLVIRGRPEVRDVDGDGRDEVLVRGRRGGWSVLWVLDPG